MGHGDRLLKGLVAALTLGATVAQPSVQFANLYKSDDCKYGSNSQEITLANPQAGTYTDVIFSQPTLTTNQFEATQGNNVGGSLSFSLDGVATTISGDSVISRLSKTEDGVTQDVDAFYVVDSSGCAYLLVTDPYKSPYDSNDIFTPGGVYDTSAEQVLGPLNEYNDLANGFATLAPTPATQSPTSGGTDFPTLAPTAPTNQPSKQPSMHPTTDPTSAPTQYPTFQPPDLPDLPDSPVPLYAGPSRCGPEVALFGPEVFPDGRLLEGQDPKAMLEPEQKHRELQGGQSDLDLCYNACKRFFAPDNSVFIFQVYWEDNQKLCGCCRECIEQIPVQFAQIYSTACPGPTTGLVISTSGPAGGAAASNGAKHGTKKNRAVTIKAPHKGARRIRYGVRVHTPTKGTTISKFGVQVSVPPGVAYSYSRIKPTNMATPTVDGDVVTGQTVRWDNLRITSKKHIQIKVHATISRSTPTNTPLTFSAATFTPGIGGEPTCLQSAGNTTVTVVP